MHWNDLRNLLWFISESGYKAQYQFDDSISLYCPSEKKIVFSALNEDELLQFMQTSLNN